MRDSYAAIACAAVAIALSVMFAIAWYCEYANTPIRYTTVQVVDEGGFEHDCVVFTHKKGVTVDCVHPNG